MVKLTAEPAVANALAALRRHGLGEGTDIIDLDLIQLIHDVATLENPRRTACGYPRLSEPKRRRRADGTTAVVVVGTEMTIGQQVRAICGTALALRWRIVRWYVDIESASSYALRVRAEFRQMLEALDAGEIDGLTAYNLDRAFRMGEDLEPVLDLADQGRIEVATATGLLDLRSPEGRAQARNLVNHARYESETNSRRQKAHAKELARRGAWHGGRRPFGYQLCRDRSGLPSLEQVPAEAKVVREVFRRFLEDGASINAIRQWLEHGRVAGRKGFQPVRGERWHHSAVRTMLSSAAAAGVREHAETAVRKHKDLKNVRQRVRIEEPVRYAGLWKPIVTIGQVDAARAILMAEGRRTTPDGGGHARSYVLTGFVVCACGHRMVGKGTIRQGVKQRRYICGKDTGGCGTVRDAGRLEAIAREQLIARAAVQNVSPSTAKDNPTFSSSDAEADLKDIDEKRTKLSISWAEGKLTDDQHDAANETLVKREAMIREAMADAVVAAVPTGLPLNVEAEWDAATVEGKQRLLKQAGIIVEVSRIGGGRRKPTAGIRLLSAAEVTALQRSA